MKLLVIGSAAGASTRWRGSSRARRASQKVFVAPGNAGTARETGVENVADRRRYRSSIEFAQQEADRAHRGRAGGAARRRHRRRVPRGGPEDLRPDAGRRAARELQGFRQELHACATASRPRPTRRSPTPRAAHAYVDAAGRADRDQGRRPRRRQGRGGGDERGRGARGGRRDAGREQDGRGRRARGDRGVPRGRGGELHRDGRRRARAAARDQPGPQAAARRRPRAQHRRHGRVLAGAGGHARAARAGRCARSSSRRIAGMAKDGIALHRLPLRRPDDRRRRASPRCWSSTAAWATRRRSRS